MSSLFDIGRPTGAFAGQEYSQERQRRHRTEDLSYAKDKAEFMDYLKDAELRTTARAAGIAQNKAITQTAPVIAEKQVAEAELATQTAEAQKTLVDARTKQQRQKIFQDMSDAQYDQVARAMYSYQDNVARGMDRGAAYTQARNELIRTHGDPKEAARMLDSAGMTEQPSDQGVQAMLGLANYATVDAKTTRSRYLLDREWMFKLAEARASAAAKDPKSVKFDPPSEKYIDNFQVLLQKSVPAYDSMNEESQRAMAVDVANWSYRARQDNVLGDAGTTPEDLQYIATNMFRSFPDLIATEDSINPFAGKEYNSVNARRLMNSALQYTNAARNATGRPDQVDMALAWDQYKDRIILRVQANEAAIKDARIAEDYQKAQAQKKALEAQQQQRVQQQQQPKPVKSSGPTQENPQPIGEFVSDIFAPYKGRAVEGDVPGL